MLEILRTDTKEIKAVCEWYLVNINGEYDPKGDMVWINEVEISPQYRNNGILKNFVREIINKCPQANFGYFWRKKKYPDRKPRIYHKFRWLRLINER